MSDPAVKRDWKEPATAAEFTKFMSQSIVDSWTTHCQQQIEFVYRFGWRSPPQLFFKIGDGWDRFQLAKEGVIHPYEGTTEQANGYYAQKLSEGKDLPWSQAKDLVVEMWRQESEVVENWEGTDKNAVEKTLTGAALAWHKDIAPYVEPVSLHEGFQIAMDDGEWAWRGTIDMTAAMGKPLVDRQGQVVAPEGVIIARDLKTAKAKWSPGQAAQKCQPIHYSIGMKHDERFKDVDTNRFEYEVMTKTKTPAVYREPVVITEERQQGYMREVAQTRREMQLAFETNTFRPNRNSWKCSKRLCSFWAECEHRWGPGVKE